MKHQTHCHQAGAIRALGFATLLAFAATAPAADGPFALSFDGVDDYVSVPHSGSFNTYLLTATAWIKTSQTTGEQGIINKYVANSLNGWQVFLFNGEVRAWFFGDSANFIWDGARGLNGGFVANGQWHHVAFVVGTTVAALYVDGVVRASRGWTGTPKFPTTTQELRLGSYPGSGFYNGLIDEVTIWTRGLTTAEIQANRLHSLIGNESGLEAYYRINEGTGTRAANAVFRLSLHQGTLVNGPLWVSGIVLAPAASTTQPDAVTSRSARLQGLASPGGTNATGWFQWGLTTNYGNVTPPRPLGGGGNNVPFSEFITGLTSDVTIHFRTVASNALGAAFGADVSFIPPHLNLTQERSRHTTTLLPNGKVLVTGGYGVSIDTIGFPTNTAELFDPATGIWTPTTPMSKSRGLHTATLLLNGTVLVVDFQGAEVYDPGTGVWTPTGSPLAAHNVHTATLLQNGKVLVAGGIGNQPEIYDPLTGNWTPTDQLNIARYNHTATLLQNGKVLVAGGEDTVTNTALTSAELYDPVSGTWTNTGSMHDARTVHTATSMINGQVLVAGGSTLTNYLSTSERYNPITGTWTRVGEPLVQQRGYHTATLLPRGAVLIVGGVTGPSSIAEVLEANSDVWRPANVQPNVARWSHTATLMPGGKVLLVGGGDENNFSIGSVELYDPHSGIWTSNAPMATARYSHSSTLLPGGRVLVAEFGNAQLLNPTDNTWSNAPPMNTPRNGHTATLLLDGKVLAAGGSSNLIDAVASAELFDPVTGLWTNTGSLTGTRNGHTATLLPDGRVLVAGGVPGGLFAAPFASAELFNPATGQWTNTGVLTSRRSGHTATLLPNGKVLVAGGSPDNFSVVASAELYDLATGLWTPTGPMTTNRTGHRATLLHNGTVLVAGGSPNTFSLPHFSAEVFDPATGTWKATTPMAVKRHNPSATLLQDGQVLVVGGVGEGYLSSAELYDPATRLWTLTAPKTTGTYAHASTLLPNGKVLVTGGWTGNGGVNLAELFDTGLGFQPLWQPRITNHASLLIMGERLVLGGIRFRGVSSTSYGRDKDSPSDNPVVHLRNLEGERTVVLSSTNWSTNSYTSLPVSGLAPGWTLATLFVNGMPATAAILEVRTAAPTPPLLTDAKTLTAGSFQFRFTNSVGALFGALAATNIALPSSNWTALGLVPEIAPGRFQFTDPQANGPQRFYRARSL